jgi:outer membrane protein insertion porin family
MQGCALYCDSNSRPGGGLAILHRFSPLTVLVVGMFCLLAILGGARSSGAGEAPAPGIVLRGNQALKDGALKKAAAAELRAYVARGGRLSDLDDAAYQMVVAYRRDGYAFAVVDYGVEKGPGGDRAVFTVTEGPRVRVGKITIEGAEVFGRGELMAFFDPENQLPKGKLVYVQAGVDRAISRIAALYRERGYLDVRVDQRPTVFSADRSQADLSVSIAEGPLYRVATIASAEAPRPMVGDTLAPLRRRWVGQPYHPRLKLILRNELLDTFGNEGYADARVTVDERRSAADGKVDLVVGIERGPRVTIESIEIKGNRKTRESVIRKRLTLGPGDRYDGRRVRASTSALYRSGLFSRVDIRLAPGSAPDSRKLAVILEETPSREIYAEPGWGSYELLRMTLGVSENNLLGFGRRLGLELGGSFRARRAVLRYTDPWFLESAFTADVPVYYSYREEPSFTRTDYGTIFNLSRRLGPSLSTTAAYSLRKTKQSDIDVDPEDDDADANYDLASLKLQFTHDDRDDPFYPSRGTRAFVSLEQAATYLGGSVDFARLTTGVRYFWPLTPRIVLGGRYTTGFIIPQADTINVPLAERFFNGGENSVRSFKEQELGPKDDRNNPVGGMAFNTFNLELRTRLTESFYGSLFADLGNVAPNRSRSQQGKSAYRSRGSLVAATFTDYFSDMRPGIGIGLGYLLPIGPARVDLAFNPDAQNKKDEDHWVLHFSIGMAF